MCLVSVSKSGEQPACIAVDCSVLVYLSSVANIDHILYGPKKVDHFWSFIKSYWKPVDEARFPPPNFSVEQAPEYFQLVLNILCAI